MRKQDTPGRRLPSLDLLKGFDAAARHLSFTRAGEELFLTQSALSRQIQALEEQLGAPLFERRHRALRLTEAGQVLQLATRAALDDLSRAVSTIRRERSVAPLTISTAIPFAALWLLPRLPHFRQMHPDVDVFISADNRILDLDRERIDLAVRYCPEALAPHDAQRLFGERLQPVCSPALASDPARPLKQPEDLARHVLLNLDDDRGRYPWLNWAQWFAAIGIPEPRPAGTVRFKPIQFAGAGGHRRAGCGARPQSTGRSAGRARQAGRSLSPQARDQPRLFHRPRGASGVASGGTGLHRLALVGSARGSGGSSRSATGAATASSPTQVTVAEKKVSMHASIAPSPWVVRFSALVQDGAKVLDVACGRGRHSRWFAARGCRVVAVDRDTAALGELAGVPGVTAVNADLEGHRWPFEAEKFDAIVVIHYLHRPLVPHLLASLADDGVLLYETFARGNEVYGKPSNPDFLLDDGELLTAVGGSLIVVAFEQGRNRRRGPGGHATNSGGGPRSSMAPDPGVTGAVSHRCHPDRRGPRRVRPGRLG
jgi:DNA-binding transcriptional LysR family regulator